MHFPKIVFLDGYTVNPGDLGWKKIEALGTLTVYDRTAPEDVLTRAADAEIIIVNKTRLTAETINALPALRLICVAATGFDVVDIKAARSRNNRSISAIDRERIDRQSSNAQEETVAATSASGNQTESQNDTEESNAEEKSPKISNPHWEDENGKTLTKALIGDEVFLCADVTDIADGASAKIKIVEKDDDGNDDFVTELIAAIQDGKIRRKWKVVYMADDDDTDSQKEMEEKGYTLPEYAFTVECDGTKSEESGQLDVRGWIKTQYIDKKTGKPLANKKYIIYLLNGDEINGSTDDSGFVLQNDLKAGKYFIDFEE